TQDSDGAGAANRCHQAELCVGRRTVQHCTVDHIGSRGRAVYASGTMTKSFRLTGQYVCLTVLSLVPCQGALITFTTRLAFNAAAPGLPTETFESGLVAPGNVITCAGPVSSATPSTCFPPGTLLPGVTYNSESALLALLGANFDGVGNTSKVLGPNFFADTFNLTFTSANAAGFDVFAGPVAGNVAIGVFSPANAPLGSFTVFAPIGGTFFGVISDPGPIGRINVASQAST